MFSKEFESDSTHDKHISDLAIENKNGEYTITIIPKAKDNTKQLRNKINALRRGCEQGAETKQNFRVTCDENKGTILISGNLFNAFTILKHYEYVSSQFADEIESDPKAKDFLEKTKDFVLPENRQDTEQSTRELNTLQEPYVRALAELDPKQFNVALQDFVERLRAQGKEVKFSAEGGQSSIQVSNK